MKLLQISKLFKDKDGNVVIIQAPNIPIILAAAFWFFAYVSNGVLEEVATIGFYIAITYWAADEMVRGDSGFRRLLGAVVITMIAVRAIIKAFGIM